MSPIVELVITIGTLSGMMWAMMTFMLRDIRKGISEIKDGLNRSEKRIDHFYEICIDMLKSKK